MGQVQYSRERYRAGFLPDAVELARARSPRAESGHIRENSDGSYRAGGGAGGRGDFSGVGGFRVRDRRDDRGGRRIPGQGTIRLAARYTGCMSKCRAGLMVLALGARLLHAGAAADWAHKIAEAGLDSEDCYRVRDLTLNKEDVRLYFTEGYIIFGKPAGEAPVAAVFVAG